MHEQTLKSVPLSTIPKTMIPPGYTMVREIGRGGFGTCWLARHDLTGAQVAIKEVGHSTAHDKALEREINLWKSLDHPNIIQLYELWRGSEATYIIQEYAQDGDLFNLVDGKRPKGLPSSQAISIFSQICHAVDYLHSRGVAHRDLKLENILVILDIAGRARVKLGDFGCAIQVCGSKLSHEWVGSIEYAAPEILANEPYDPKKADCWSLGVVLFALTAGYLPFSKLEDDAPGLFDVERRVRQRILAHDLLLPTTIPESARNIIKGLLHPSPTHRWPVDHALRALSMISSGEGLKEEPALDPRRFLSTITLTQLPGVQEWLQGVDTVVTNRKLDATNALCKILMSCPGRFANHSICDGSADSSLSSSSLPTPDLRDRILLPSESPIIPGSSERPRADKNSSKATGWLGMLWAKPGEKSHYRNIASETSSPELS